MNIESTLMLDRGNSLEKCCVYELSNDAYLFVYNGKNICMRKHGRVIFDNNWKSIPKYAKKYLKTFLGEMYLAEAEKEIKNGEFLIGDLNVQ